MIVGTGVDIVEVDRIKKIINDNPRFLERCFTALERALFQEKGMNVQTIAAGFAAKEAVSKALGTGIRGFNLIDIEILRDPLGKPVVNMIGNAKEISLTRGINHYEISLSHTATNAIAFVVAIGSE